MDLSIHMASTEPLASTRVSGIGGWTAAVIAAVPAVWGVLDPALGGLMLASLVGMPTALVLGTIYARQARSGDTAGAFVVAGSVGIVAAAVPALLIGCLLALPAVLAGPAGLAILPLALAFSIPVMIITVPCAVAWVLVMRMLPPTWAGGTQPRIRSRLARVVALTLLVALVSLGALPGIVRPEPVLP